MAKILEQKQNVCDAISPRSVHLSRHVRLLASALRDRTEASPFAADTLLLSNQVDGLCHYVEQLHESVEALLAKIDAVGTSADGTAENDLSPEEKKAMEIQREVHEFNPAAKDTIKALFIWRDAPE